MISVACPHCHILVVEADNPRSATWPAPTDTAARLGAQVISNSYGQPENGVAMTYAHYYQLAPHGSGLGRRQGLHRGGLPGQPGHGDSGRRHRAHPLARPARLGREASGTSRSPAPAAAAAPPTSAGRPGSTEPRARAGPSPMSRRWPANVPIYNKVYGGWITVGGTSAAAPLIAGVYGLAGNGNRVTTSDLYGHRRCSTSVSATTPGRRDAQRSAATTTCA